jgi:hypothetical protein
MTARTADRVMKARRTVEPLAGDLRQVLEAINRSRLACINLAEVGPDRRAAQCYSSVKTPT